VPLLLLTGRRGVMGVYVNSRPTQAAAWACAVLISGLNVFLLWRQFLA
jgi:manganese transport protein